MKFKVHAPYVPTGDQPAAIEKLVDGIQNGNKHQVLLGATGTGKTFTIASVVERVQKPALVMAHNKTLAAQLYAEFKEFFPENAVEYFVSYYDYYQPEAYVPRHDLYIEKDADINAEIERLHQMEIAFGPFERSVRIAIPFERDQVVANLEEGFLSVVLPKSAPRRRRIELTGD